MGKKRLWLLIVGSGLSSGLILVDKCLVPIPAWLSIPLLIVAMAAIVAYIIFMCKGEKK